MADADLRRALLRGRLERPVPPEPGQGPDRPVGRVRPAHPDRLRRRPRAGPGRGRPGRRPGRAPGRPAGAVRRHPAGAGQHLDDDQRPGPVAAGAVPGGGRRTGRRHHPAGRHHPERHHQGVPVPRHLYLPARSFGPADHRPDRLHGDRDAAVEPGQRVRLPPPGGGGHAGPGDRLRPRHRDHHPGRRARARPGRAAGRGGGADLVLRQRRGPVRRGDVQAAGLRPPLGLHHRRSATGSKTPGGAASATACRSTRSA